MFEKPKEKYDCNPRIKEPLEQDGKRYSGKYVSETDIMG